MVFSSVTFLFLFMPVVILLHLVIPGIRAKNIFLIIASLIFYAWGEPVYVLLMVFSAAVNWLVSFFVVKDGRRGAIWTGVAVAFNIGLLFVFKYAGLVAGTISLLPRVNVPDPGIHLPIGISFYTFQAMSYVIDTKRDHSNFQRNFANVLLYIVLFPQLIAGPIVKYHDIREQFAERTVTARQMAHGIRRLIVGLSKKLLLADRVAVIADAMFAKAPSGGPSCLGAWIGAACYLLQIYLDFSGYSDMAIGLGEMMGFHFGENFRYPYISANIREFWRRWHISLSTWFREYLYIPLGGNRRGMARMCLNLMIVFAATGIWHGANVTFLVWGLYNGIFIVLERLGVIRAGRKRKWAGRIYAIIVIAVGFVLFRAETLGDAGKYLGAMAGLSGAGIGDVTQYLSPLMIFIIAAAVVACLPVAPYLRERICARANDASRLRNMSAGVRCANGTAGSGAIRSVAVAASYAGALCLFALCIMTLAANSYSPFIYFNF